MHTPSKTGFWLICSIDAKQGLVDTCGKGVDGIDIPDGCVFGNADLLTVHMFHALTLSQSMTDILDVSASRGGTIATILAAEFPGSRRQADNCSFQAYDVRAGQPPPLYFDPYPEGGSDGGLECWVWYDVIPRNQAEISLGYS
jgi:hypothetical protein